MSPDFPSDAGLRCEFLSTTLLQSVTQGKSSTAVSIHKASYTHQSSKLARASILTSDARWEPHHWESQVLRAHLQHFKVRRPGFPDVSLLNEEPEFLSSEPPLGAVHQELSLASLKCNTDPFILSSLDAHNSESAPSTTYPEPPSPIMSEIHISKSESRKHVDNETSDQTEGQSKRKRPRTAVQLQKKLDIVSYWEDNGTLTLQDIGRHFRLPRTTVYGIISNRNTLKAIAKSKPRAALTLETSRMVESRFRILEELLMTWFTNLRAQYIPVTGKKITTQAFEIHRMLSGVLAEPLPACLFSSGWLKGFKKRRGISLGTMRGDTTAAAGDDIASLRHIDFRESLVKYKMENVYSCDVADMFLRPMPTAVFRDQPPQPAQSTVDSSSVSVLLCCNATGADKLPPLTFVQQSEQEFQMEGSDGMRIDGSAKYITPSLFTTWLAEFDMRLDHEVILLLDNTMWDLTRGQSDSPNFSLNKIKLSNIPPQLTASAPMSAGIIRAFKTFYNTLAVRKFCKPKAPEQTESPAGTKILEDHLKFIPNAWQKVQSSAIETCFQSAFAAIDPFRYQPQDLKGSRTNLSMQDRDSTESELRTLLKAAFPDIPDSVLQYYLTQDKDLGPSRFLWEALLAMQSHEDFESCFGLQTKLTDISSSDI